MGSAENGAVYHDEATLRVLSNLIGGRPDVGRRKVFGHPSFTAGGKVFACVMERGIALKLPPETIARLEDPAIAPFAPMGHSMTGWVEIRRAAAADYEQDEALIDLAAGYVAEQARLVQPRRS